MVVCALSWMCAYAKMYQNSIKPMYVQVGARPSFHGIRERAAACKGRADSELHFTAPSDGVETYIRPLHRPHHVSAFCPYDTPSSLSNSASSCFSRQPADMYLTSLIPALLASILVAATPITDEGFLDHLAEGEMHVFKRDSTLTSRDVELAQRDGVDLSKSMSSIISVYLPGANSGNDLIILNSVSTRHGQA